MSNDLESNVRSVRDDIERLARIATGDDLTAADWAWMIDEGADLEPLEHVDEDLNGWDAQEAARDLLGDRPLEVVELATRQPGGEWVYSHSVVVFCTGGPHVELNTKTGRVEGYWAGDLSSMSVDQTVVDFFESFGE